MYTNSDWKDLLTSYRGQTITYDAAGNPLSYYNGQSYTFTWEDGNQLASAVTGGKTISFDYNSDGIRTAKYVAGEADYYYRLNGTKVVEMVMDSDIGYYRFVFVYDENGSPYGFDLYEGETDTTPTKYYYVLNLQGDVVQLRNSSNGVVANYTYDAWGKLLSVTNASGSVITNTNHFAYLNPIRYRGYFYDTETKLYYCNSRYYDPQIKRFINADVYLSTGTGFLGYNMYAYCNNNPVMCYDPSGHMITGWDSAYLPDGDKNILTLITAEWHAINSKQRRDELHEIAVNIRKDDLPEGYKVANNGYLISSDGSHYLSSYSFDGYIIDYTITEHAMSVDVRQTGVGVLYAFYVPDGKNLNTLASFMLAEYQAIYGKEFRGRTVSGVAREIGFHYVPDASFRAEPLSFIAKYTIIRRANPADIEDVLHGSNTWYLFEYVWNW